MSAIVGVDGDVEVDPTVVIDFNATRDEARYTGGLAPLRRAVAMLMNLCP